MPSRGRKHDTDHGIYGSPGDVRPWDIRFDPGDRAFVDVRPDGSTRIRIATESALESGRIVTRGDTGVVSFPMTARPAGTTTFWEAIVHGLLEYTFAFRSRDDRPVYYVPAGVANAVERLDRFSIPKADAFDTPEWAQGAVIYQIFPDRFDRAGEARPDLAPWGAPPHPHQFQGGDLEGIAGRIDYLADLGVEVLYLNPIFTSPSNHRYDTIDYFNVDPLLGGNDALDRLVDAIHSRGMRIILDASLNHVHPHFFAFADLVERGPNSRYRDWFVVQEWPLQVRYRPEAGPWTRQWVPIWRRQLGMPIRRVRSAGPAVEPTYEAWYGVPSMPRVDLSNPDARDYMLGVARHWVAERGIDGWRMDVARYVDPDFWDDFRETVKSANPDAYLIAEVMGDAGPWVQGNRFDATMNYTFRDIALAFLAEESISGTEALDLLTRLWGQYAWPVTLANQNLLDSHDTARFLTRSGGDRSRLTLALLLQMTYPGAPGVYYGNEIGLEGGEDPGSRSAFPWSPDPRADPLYQDLRNLVSIRRKDIRSGSWMPHAGGRAWLSYLRQSGSSMSMTVINRGRRPVTVKPPRSPKRIAWGPASISEGAVDVPGGSGAVVRL